MSGTPLVVVAWSDQAGHEQTEMGWLLGADRGGLLLSTQSTRDRSPAAHELVVIPVRAIVSVERADDGFDDETFEAVPAVAHGLVTRAES